MEKTIFVVFINDNEEVLCLRRGEHKKYYAGQWDAVSGKIKESESPEECLKREIAEEINITDFQILKQTEPFLYEEDGKKWLMHSYLCKIKKGSIVLDKEHSEYKWMSVKKLLSSNYAPPFKLGLQNLMSD